MSPNRDRSDDTPTDPPMSLEQIGGMMKKMDKALFGNKYDPDNEPGFFAIMTELHRDYYGDKKTGRMGTKYMIVKLWEMHWKVLGGALALGAAGSVLGWLITNWITAKH